MILNFVASMVATLVLVTVVVAVAVWRGFIPMPELLVRHVAGVQGPVASASYYPPDTVAYVWVTLAPDDGQLTQMREVWDRLNEHQVFTESVDELKDDFLVEAGVDFDADVRPWLGAEFSAGYLGVAPDTGDPLVAVALSVRDQEEAAAFLGRWLDGDDTRLQKHRGYDVWVDDWSGEAFGLTDDWLLVASDVETLKSVVDRIDGADLPSLADLSTFKEAHAVLPERRFMWYYLDYPALVELEGGPVPGELDPLVQAPTDLGADIPGWVAGSVGWLDRGLKFAVVAPNVAPSELDVVNISAPGRREPAQLLPADAMAFVAGGFDPDLDHWRSVLRQQPLPEAWHDLGLSEELNYLAASVGGAEAPQLGNAATVDAGLDLVLWLVEQVAGVNLETEFMDQLSGRGVLALVNSDFDPEGWLYNPDTHAADVVAILSHRSEGAGPLGDTMQELEAWLEAEGGVEFVQSDVGAERTASALPLDDLGLAYQPGYVLHDGHLIMGSTLDALSAVVVAKDGKADSLADGGKYGRVVGHLPATRQLLAYVDLGRLTYSPSWSDHFHNPDQIDFTRDLLGALAVSGSSDAHYVQAVVVLTLFPDVAGK